MAVKRIILVDDEVYVTSTPAGEFRKAGHEVSIASSGAEATTNGAASS